MDFYSLVLLQVLGGLAQSYLQKRICKESFLFSPSDLVTCLLLRSFTLVFLPFLKLCVINEAVYYKKQCYELPGAQQPAFPVDT